MQIVQKLYLRKRAKGVNVMTDVRTILEALCIILVTNLLFVAPAVGKPLALEKDQLYLVFDPRLQGVG